MYGVLLVYFFSTQQYALKLLWLAGLGVILGWLIGASICEFGSVRFGSLGDWGFRDEPESLILAQSERWRHA